MTLADALEGLDTAGLNIDEDFQVRIWFPASNRKLEKKAAKLASDIMSRMGVCTGLGSRWNGTRACFYFSCP